MTTTTADAATAGTILAFDLGKYKGGGAVQGAPGKGSGTVLTVRHHDDGT